jgi:hypothetical protein
VEVGGDVEGDFGAAEGDRCDAQDAGAGKEVIDRPRTGEEFGFKELTGLVVQGVFTAFRAC